MLDEGHTTRVSLVKPFDHYRSVIQRDVIYSSVDGRLLVLLVAAVLRRRCLH